MGQRFVDELPGRKVAQEYKLSLPPILPADVRSVVIYMGNEGEGTLAGGEFYVQAQGKKEGMETMENVWYSYRIYGNSLEELRRNVETASLLIRPKRKARLIFITVARGKVTNLDAAELATEYVAMGRQNCYSTAEIGAEGATFSIQIAAPEVNVYANSASLPENLADFAYKFPSQELAWTPADHNSGAISIPLQSSYLKPNTTTYFCVEGTGRPVAYAVSMAQYVPNFMEGEQSQRLYVHGKHPIVLFHDEQVHSPSALRVGLKVYSGCVRLMVKPYISTYHAYEVYAKMVAGRASPFSEISPDDILVDKVTSADGERVITVPRAQKEGRCSGRDVYTHCPSFLAVENCDSTEASHSVATISVQNDSPVLVVPADRLLLAIPKGKTKRLIIPEVSPAVDTVIISVLMRERVVPTRLAQIGVSRKGTLEDPSQGEKVADLTGEHNETVIEFNATHDGPLSGDYYITIKAEDTVNMELTFRAYDSRDNDDKTVINLKQVTQNNHFPLTPAISTHQIGYFTFFLNNTDPATGATKKHDLVITATPSEGLSDVEMGMSLSPWPTFNGAPTWNGSVLRVSADDDKYKPNSYYYIVALGKNAEPSEEEEQQPQRKATLWFNVLEGKKATEIHEERNYTFSDTMAFFLDAAGKDDLVIRKKSDTAEALFVTASPALAFSDNFDFVMTSKYNEENTAQDLEDELVIRRADLAKHNPGCVATAQSSTGGCRINLTVQCYTQKCLYELQVSRRASSETKGEDKKEGEGEKKTKKESKKESGKEGEKKSDL